MAEMKRNKSSVNLFVINLEDLSTFSQYSLQNHNDKQEDRKIHNSIINSLRKYREK